jgi:hypothetical protein
LIFSYLFADLVKKTKIEENKCFVVFFKQKKRKKEKKKKEIKIK